jgi:hypothetical protein
MLRAMGLYRAEDAGPIKSLCATWDSHPKIANKDKQLKGFIDVIRQLDNIYLPTFVERTSIFW